MDNIFIVLSLFRTMWTKVRYMYHVNRYKVARMQTRIDTDILD